MLLTDISDDDAVRLLEVKNLLIRTVQEMKFTLGDARVANRAIEWFDAFLAAASNTQKMEQKEKLKAKKTEGLSAVKVKEFSPGNITKAKRVSKKKK